jgi:hypothetical protein
MKHFAPTIAATPAQRRVAAVFAALVTAGLLAGCALQPGRPYDFSQVRPDHPASWAQLHDTYRGAAYSNYGYNNFPH